MPDTGIARAESGSTQDAAKDRRFFTLLLIIAVIDLWAVPLRSSFWLDEAGTFWVIKDGFPALFARSVSWAGQYPLYFLVDWAAFAAGGRHEWILRLPSFFALAVAIWLFYRLAVRLFDVATAQFAVLVFVCSEQVIFAAADARPYALGLCMVIGSAWALVRWLDTGRSRYAAGYVGFTVLVAYLHYLFALPLAVLGVYGMWRARGEGKVALWKLPAAWAACGILILPLVPLARQYYQGRAAHTFSSTPSMSDLLGAIAPAVLIGSIGLGLLAAWLIFPRYLQGRFAPCRESLLLAAGWALAPPLALYAIAVTTPVKLFVPRYFLPCVPGLALVAGWLVCSAVTSAGRRVVATFVAVAAIFSFGTLVHGHEDWAGAARRVRSLAGSGNLPVLAASGFVEASDPKALDDPRLREVLFAPQVMYPPPGRLIRLPYAPGPAAEAYVERLLPEVEQQKRFVLLVRFAGLPWEPWLRGRLASYGFRSETLGDFGSLGAYLFRRGN
jgi:4-amino-4-deoxy-L-arabinose transferase-like glycosyltransferase